MAGYTLPPRGLVSQADSSVIEAANVPRSKYLNRWTRKTAFDADYLIPILCDELLPGDHMTYNVTAFLRMATPLFPQFDNLTVDSFFFFVPCRLVWKNWVRFMGEQPTPLASIDFTVPQIDVTGTPGHPITGGLLDHFGVPPLELLAADPELSINALPFRAYNLIYNTWFRDENIQMAANQEDGDGPDIVPVYELQRRAKRHDYFTSALPWTQKFSGTTVPVGTGAPVRGIGIEGPTPQYTGGTGDIIYETARTALVGYEAWSVPGGSDKWKMNLDPNTGFPLIYADLSQSTGVAINTLRQAFLIQQLLERDARGGTRYVELIRSHFGVINPDFRLARPEYIGGGQSPLNITPIAQTAPTAGVPLGALGGAGTSAGTHRASYAATEHGYVIGMLNVRAELSYQQGLHRMFSRKTRYDFYWPSLAGLGEQAIYRKEILLQGVPGAPTPGPGGDDTVFGYQERWQEYRTKYSDVTGLMRSGVTDTLDMWHVAEFFDVAVDGAPYLNDYFMRARTPMARILAAAELAQNQQFLADILYERTAVRPLPMYGTPVQLGRF